MPATKRSRLPRGTLNRDRILVAATSLLATGGMSGLTMTTLAERLQADRKAVYRHFRDKDDLLAALIDRLLEELPPVPPGSSGAASLEHVARHLLETVVRHRGSVALLAEGPFSSAEIRLLESTLVALRADGLDDERAVDLMQAALALVIGAAVQADAGSDGSWDDLDLTIQALSGCPAITGTAALWRRTPQAQFDRALGLLLATAR